MLPLWLVPTFLEFFYVLFSHPVHQLYVVEIDDHKKKLLIDLSISISTQAAVA